MHSTHPGKEQPYPPQMKRYLDPVLLWTVAATATSRVRLNASTLSTFYYEPPHLARMPPGLPRAAGCPDPLPGSARPCRTYWHKLVKSDQLGGLPVRYCGWRRPSLRYGGSTPATPPPVGT